MRTTLILEDELIKKAMKMAKKDEKTAVVHMALQALIEKLAQKELIEAGGKNKGFKMPKRR